MNNLEDDSCRKIFFEKLETVLQTPLHLAQRNKRTDKSRIAQICSKKANSEQTNDLTRYLEDFIITISDLMIYFFVAKILTKLENAKSELEMNYRNVCKWFILMQNDEHIFGTFSFSQHKKIQFNLNDEICLNEKFELIQIQDEDQKLEW